MKKSTLAICDRDLDYLNSLLSLFKSKELPFEVIGFSRVKTINEYTQTATIEMLIISETEYERLQKSDKIRKIVVLGETRKQWGAEIKSISKYQSASNLYKGIMEIYAKEENIITTAKAKQSYQMIGIYSPIHRCLQTTLALTLGQILAEKKRVIYVSFECYSGLENLMGKKFAGNISDLLYFYQCDKEKLPFRLESILEKLNKLDMIPAAESFEDYMHITPDEWLDFLDEIMQAGNYDCMILDLTEHVNGLYQILNSCNKIYTLVKDDRMARAKLAHYELLLERSNEEGILEKTCKYSLPIMQCLPSELERLGRSELAKYAKAMLQTDGFIEDEQG